MPRSNPCLPCTSYIFQRQLCIFSCLKRKLPWQPVKQPLKVPKPLIFYKFINKAMWPEGLRQPKDTFWLYFHSFLTLFWLLVYIFDFLASESLCTNNINNLWKYEQNATRRFWEILNISFDIHTSESLYIKRLKSSKLHNVYLRIVLTICENINKIQVLFFWKWWKTVLTRVPQNLFVWRD